MLKSLWNFLAPAARDGDSRDLCAVPTVRAHRAGVNVLRGAEILRVIYQVTWRFYGDVLGIKWDMYGDIYINILYI